MVAALLSPSQLPVRARRCKAIWNDAAVQEIAIKGDRAAVRFSNGKTIELHRVADGSWMISKSGENAGRGFFK